MERNSNNLELLRKRMREFGINAAIIPHNDPHQSEYIAPYWQLRGFFSNFDGSAGTLVVTDNKAALWTDSRYFIQAQQQMKGTGIELMKQGVPLTPEIHIWLSENLRRGDIVAVNAWTISENDFEELKTELSADGFSIVDTFDPAEDIWINRPKIPASDVFVHATEYAGEPAASKVKRVLDQLPDVNGPHGVLFSSLDDIAWMLNIRGNDIKCNPVKLAYLYVSANTTVLFMSANELTPVANDYFKANGVTLRPYNEVTKFIDELPKDAYIGVDFKKTSHAIVCALGPRAYNSPSPVPFMKVIKNGIQIEGIKNAMIRDGAALVYAFMEIENRMSHNIPTSEIDIADILLYHRSKQPLFFDESFDTIAGYAEHGAIVHYSATHKTNCTLKPEGLLLVDSGAQYLDGTTDITRTISLGTPTPQQKNDFTLVLKGMIALACAIFPEETKGIQLEILAKQYLWKEGLQYMHGTGHGIGHFLNVHEGPHGIRSNGQAALEPIRAGMITSDEPGLYRQGEYGIRCENCLLVTPAPLPSYEGTQFLRFETLTLFPFDSTLIDRDILTQQEIEWLNNYHERVFSLLTPLLSEDAVEWLKMKTK